MKSSKCGKEPKLSGGEWTGRNIYLIMEDDKKLAQSRRKEKKDRKWVLRRHKQGRNRDLALGTNL